MFIPENMEELCLSHWIESQCNTISKTIMRTGCLYQHFLCACSLYTENELEKCLIVLCDWKWASTMILLFDMWSDENVAYHDGAVK